MVHRLAKQQTLESSLELKTVQIRRAPCIVDKLYSTRVLLLQYVTMTTQQQQQQPYTEDTLGRTHLGRTVTADSHDSKLAESATTTAGL